MDLLHKISGIWQREPLPPRAYLRLWLVLAALQLFLAGLWYEWVPVVADRYPDLIAGHLAVLSVHKLRDFVFLAPILVFSAFCLLLFGKLHPEGEVSGAEFERPTQGKEARPRFAFIDDIFVLAFSFAAPILLARLLYAWFSWLGLGIAIFLSCLSLLHGRRAFPAGGPLLWARALQCLYPLLLLRILRFDYHEATESIQYFAGPGAIFLTILGIMALLWKSAVSLREEKLLTTGIACLAFFSTWTRLPVSPFLFDDYHLGEMFVPLQQFFDHGLSPFRDFVSVHGALALVYGAINRFFFLDTYATAPFAVAILRSLASAVWCALLVRWYRGSLVLVLPLVSIFLIPGWDRYFFFPLLIFVVAHPRYEAWKKDWPFLVLSLVLLCLLNPATGMAAAIAILPLLAWHLRKDARWTIAGGIALAATGALLWFYGRGFAQFVVENGKGTQEAFGLSLFESQVIPKFLAGLFPKPIEMVIGAVAAFLKLYGWLFVLWLIPLFWRSRRGSVVNFIFEGDKLFTLIALVGFAMVPYTYGRIGTMGLNRIGYFSLLYLGVFLPLAAQRWRLDVRRSTIFISLLLFALLYRASAYVKELQSPWRLFGNTEVATEFARIPQLETAIPGLGAAFLDKSMQKELSDFLSGWTWLDRGTFLDFTNRQNHFYLTRTQSRQLYPSFLVTANQETQSRVVAAIVEKKPDGAWIAPQHDHEAIPVSARAYRVFRWLMEEAPIASHSRFGDHEFLRFDWGQGTNHPLERDKALPAFSFFVLGFERLPRIWGDNWDRLANRFHARGTQKSAMNQVLAFPSTVTGDKRADFLLVDFGKESFGNARLEILSSGGEPLAIVPFRIEGSGRLLFPVGSIGMFWHSRAHALRLVSEKNPTAFLAIDLIWLRLVD